MSSPVRQARVSSGRQHRLRGETTTRPKRTRWDDSALVRFDRHSQFTRAVRHLSAHFHSHQQSGNILHTVHLLEHAPGDRDDEGEGEAVHPLEQRVAAFEPGDGFLEVVLGGELVEVGAGGRAQLLGMGYGHRSAKLKVIASNGRMLIGSSFLALAIRTHSPSRSSNASRVRSAGSTSHRWGTPSRA